MGTGNLVIHGARVWVYINGNRFGRVESFGFQIATPKKRIKCIDMVTPIELAQKDQEVFWTMEIYRTMGDGGIEGPGMNGIGAELPRNKYFTVLLLDALSQCVLFQADYCAVDGQSWVHKAKQFSRGTVNGGALDWNNEIQPLRR